MGRRASTHRQLDALRRRPRNVRTTSRSTRQQLSSSGLNRCCLNTNERQIRSLDAFPECPR